MSICSPFTLKIPSIFIVLPSVMGLAGCIPKEVGNATMLKSINFAGNNITGITPKEVGNATMLKYLDLSYNNITGNLFMKLSVKSKRLEEKNFFSPTLSALRLYICCYGRFNTTRNQQPI